MRDTRTLVREFHRRIAQRQSSSVARRAAAMFSGLSQEQSAAILDNDPQVAVLGTRRSGKSRGFLRRMAYDAATIPDFRQVYINTTFPECERIAWRGNKREDGLLGLNEIYGLGATPNQGKMRMHWPSGSVIEIGAADDERKIGKFLGGAYHRVWIDEAQKMPHIQRLIEDVLGAAMTDFEGQVILTGTPSRVCDGYYYEITKRAGGILDEEVKPSATGWSVHTLNILNNPFFGETREERFARTIEREMKKRGWIGGEPGLLREWYGQWVKEDALWTYDVHRVKEDDLLYAPARTTAEDWDIATALADLPDLAGWHFGMACDLGYFPDPFAFVIWAWSEQSPNLYELVSWRKEGLIPDSQAAVIQRVIDELPQDLAFLVADADGAAGVVAGWSKGWEDRYPIPIVPAQKSQKVTFRELYNGDIRNGLVKLRRDGFLHNEMRRLPIRTLPNGKIVEDQRRDKEGRRKYPNDCADASLYGHREAYHHRFVEAEKEPEYGTSEYWKREEERMFEQALEEVHEEDGFYVN